MYWSFLFGWWRRRPATSLQHLRLVLYARQGCHLCESAGECLRAEQRRHGFTFEVVDIDKDPELAARYGEQVPVVTVNGQVRFRGGVNRVLLTRLLRAESGSRPSGSQPSGGR